MPQTLAEHFRTGDTKIPGSCGQGEGCPWRPDFKVDWATTRTKEEFLAEYYDKIIQNAINPRGGIRVKTI